MSFNVKYCFTLQSSNELKCLNVFVLPVIAELMITTMIINYINEADKLIFNHDFLNVRGCKDYDMKSLSYANFKQTCLRH